MPPLPKRRHSTQRSGKRQSQDAATIPMIILCKSCGKQKLPHRLCTFCGAKA